MESNPVTQPGRVSRAVAFAASRGWLPPGLVRFLQGTGGGLAAFVLLALGGPLGDDPPPPPAPPAGEYFTPDQLASARASWVLIGRRDALLDLHNALSTNRVRATRAAVQHLLEESP